MKIGLIVAAVTMMAGCGASAQQPSVPVSATTLSSATLTPSTLAPAAWDGDENAPRAGEVAAPTWGAAAHASADIARTPQTPAR